MKQHLIELINNALYELKKERVIPEDFVPSINVDRTRDPSHGDYASNIAMMLAKQARRKPRDLADLLVSKFADSDKVTKVEVANPGFINFFINQDTQLNTIKNILETGDEYGQLTLGADKHVQVEFVSANPTGPLHVGHGRGAAYGATVANLLEAAGFKVHREYYVNDAGRQMDILAASVWLRYLELCGEELAFPSNAYKGDYVFDIAATVHREHADAMRHPGQDVMQGLPIDAQADGSGDKEAHIDAVISKMKQLLSASEYRIVFDAGLLTIIDDIKKDLAEFGVIYDDWFSERSLMESGSVDVAIDRLKENNYIYEKDGALWFRTSDFGDEKDRVIVRENGQKTYFASDIAYHMNKLERGYDRVVDVWGADHHGYVPRVKAALEALGDDPAKLDVLLVQFAILYRGGEKAQMSTRSGEFVTLRELRQEVGNDAARFFYVMRKCEQHLDFDLDLAKSKSNENPVYYIQYAYARICSVFRQLDEKGFKYDDQAGLQHLSMLQESHEQALITRLSRFPEVIETSAINYEPHQLAYYLRDLANELHTYYNAHQFLVGDPNLRNARMVLIAATRQVLTNGLKIIGVSAPEVM
ncbi:MAG: arginine--tRNA ligase [Gammaproteobacteria bacterium]|nr:arginine--tRNA ligase [Gammaproteobacteria bacterium]